MLGASCLRREILVVVIFGFLCSCLRYFLKHMTPVLHSAPEEQRSFFSDTHVQFSAIRARMVNQRKTLRKRKRKPRPETAVAATAAASASPVRADLPAGGTASPPSPAVNATLHRDAPAMSGEDVQRVHQLQHAEHTIREAAGLVMEPVVHRSSNLDSESSDSDESFARIGGTGVVGEQGGRGEQQSCVSEGAGGDAEEMHAAEATVPTHCWALDTQMDSLQHLTGRSASSSHFSAAVTLSNPSLSRHTPEEDGQDCADEHEPDDEPLSPPLLTPPFLTPVPQLHPHPQPQQQQVQRCVNPASQAIQLPCSLSQQLLTPWTHSCGSLVPMTAESEALASLFHHSPDLPSSPQSLDSSGGTTRRNPARVHPSSLVATSTLAEALPLVQCNDVASSFVRTLHEKLAQQIVRLETLGREPSVLGNYWSCTLPTHRLPNLTNSLCRHARVGTCTLSVDCRSSGYTIIHLWPRLES